jgi:hypothetical protein
VTPDEYCRELEAYLTRKNDGHLIRIVGPAFERVLGWADQGIPLKVAHQGIDRYFERYYAKGPRRRPVRVEFCEADVLDAFDDWRRAVGVVIDGNGAAPPGRRRAGLATHIDRAVARLTALRASVRVPSDADGASRPLALSDAEVERIIRALDACRGRADHARGEGRQAILDELVALDAQLLRLARDAASPDVLAELERQADLELLPFRERMPAGAWPLAREAAVNRALRDRARLPVLTVD